MHCVGVGEQLERQTIATIGTGVKDNPGLEHRVEQFRVQGSVLVPVGKPSWNYLAVRAKQVKGRHQFGDSGFVLRCPTAGHRVHLPQTTLDSLALDEGLWLLQSEVAQGDREDRNSATPAQLQRYRAP